MSEREARRRRPSAGRPLRDHRLFPVILGCLAAISPMSIDMGLPALPRIEAGFGLHLGQGSYTLTAYVAGFALAPVLAGPVSDRAGRRPVLVLGLVLFSLAAITCAMSASFRLLVIARCAQGFLAGVCAIMPLAIVRDTSDGAQARAHLSIIAATMGLAPLVAPTLGSLLLAWSGRWQMIFLAQAMLAMALAIGSLILIPETRPPGPIGGSGFLRTYLLVTSSRQFRTYTAIYAIGFAGLFAFISISPAVFIGSFGVGHAAFSAIFASAGGSFFVGSLTSARLSRHQVRPDTLLMTGLALMVGADMLLLLAARQTHPALFILPVCVSMFSFGLFGPTAMHRAVEPYPLMAGAASGLLRSVQMATAASVSAVLAYASSHIGPPMALAGMMGICAMVAILLYLLFARRQRPVTSEVLP